MLRRYLERLLNVLSKFSLQLVSRAYFVYNGIKKETNLRNPYLRTRVEQNLKNSATLKACKVLIDSQAGLPKDQYLFLPLKTCKVFYILGILIDSSARILYHKYLLIFANSFKVFTDTSEGFVYSFRWLFCHHTFFHLLKRLY